MTSDTRSINVVTIIACLVIVIIAVAFYIYIKRREKSYREHMEILKNLRERNLQRARDSLHYHLRSVARSAIDVLRNGE